MTDSGFDPIEASDPLAGRPSAFARSSPASPLQSTGRVEANTALLKLSQNPTDVSGFEETTLMDDQSGITPAEDEDGGEAASARIAQEYRRQVRIKRLAEEIQQAERAKKKDDDQRRKSELAPKQIVESNKKQETAKLNMGSTDAGSIESDDPIAQRRVAAMDAVKTSSGAKSRSGLIFFLCSLLLVALAAGTASVYLNHIAAQRDVAVKSEHAQHLEEMRAADDKALLDAKKMQAREAELLQQKLQLELNAKNALEEKLALDEQFRQKETEHRKLLAIETAHRIADEKRMQEENQRLIENANRERDELRKKIEEAQRIVREKLKKEQEADAAKAEHAVNPALPAEPAKVDPLKTNTAKVELISKPPLTGEVKTIPSDTTTVPGKLELPSGGVRLVVKASDPYGGALAFQWRQLKGAAVDIADPAAAKFLDGKWISQTYFVAREPGEYEFEVTVKNEDGVETRKKFPIEVLPPTTLK